jgi:hypothetical protein
VTNLFGPDPLLARDKGGNDWTDVEAFQVTPAGRPLRTAPAPRPAVNRPDPLRWVWLAALAIGIGALLTLLGALGIGPATGPTAHAAVPASNSDNVRHTAANVFAITHGHTAGTVTACVSANGEPIKIISFRVHDWSRGIYTRMGGGAYTIRSGHQYCATTGNWFRFMRSDVTASVVNQSNGAYGWIVMPVS